MAYTRNGSTIFAITSTIGDLLGGDLSNLLVFSWMIHLYLHSINETLFITFLVCEVIHNHGHMRHNACNIMPSGATQEDTHQLDCLSFLHTKLSSTQVIFSYHS